MFLLKLAIHSIRQQQHFYFCRASESSRPCLASSAMCLHSLSSLGWLLSAATL